MSFTHHFARLAAVAVVSLLPIAVTAAPVSAGATNVTVDPGSLAALTGLGFTITPVSPATLTATSSVVASFPITGGDTTADIFHSGGLTFARNGVSASLVNFDINVPSLTLFGQVVTASSTLNAVPLFNIGASNGVFNLTLTSTLGSALSSLFPGVPNLTGAPIGTATINPTPEPGTLALAGLALVGGLATLRKRLSARP